MSAAEVPPLSCSRCGGGVLVEIVPNADGYGIRDIRIECDGTSAPNYRPPCGAVWDSCGDSR